MTVAYCISMQLIATGYLFVSVLTLGCDDSVIVDAFREVLSMLDEVWTAAFVRYCLYVLLTMSMLNHNEFAAVCSKYSHDVDLMTPVKIKDMICQSFASTVLL